MSNTPEMDRIWDIAAAEAGVSAKMLRTRQGRGRPSHIVDKPRKALALALRQYGYTMAGIGSMLGRHHSIVAHAQRTADPVVLELAGRIYRRLTCEGVSEQVMQERRRCLGFCDREIARWEQQGARAMAAVAETIRTSILGGLEIPRQKVEIKDPEKDRPEPAFRML